MAQIKTFLIFLLLFFTCSVFGQVQNTKLAYIETDASTASRRHFPNSFIYNKADQELWILNTTWSSGSFSSHAGKTLINSGGGGGSGDFSDGGEAGGANRSLGNTDNFALSFITNGLNRLSVAANGNISASEKLAINGSSISPTYGLSVNEGINVNLGVIAFNNNVGIKFTGFNTSSSLGIDAGSSLGGLERGNTLIGNDAGTNISGTEFNTFVGASAGENSLNTGSIFIGHEAGQNSNANNAIFIGRRAGRNDNTNGKIIIGSSLLQNSLQIPLFNTAGVLQTDASGNITVGTPSGGGDFSNGGDVATADRTLGNTDNFSLGFLTNNQNRLNIESDGDVVVNDGNFDVNSGYYFLGGNRFIHNQGFAANIGIGATALDGVTSGASNIAIGQGAGNSITTEVGNVFVGTSSALLATGLTNSVFIGSSSGVSFNTGNNNTLIGDEAGSNFSNSDDNTIIGASAMSSGTGVRMRNTVIGTEAFQNSTANSSDNVIIGYQAHEFAGASANVGNVIIGYQAGSNSGTLTNALFIGRNAGESETASNKIIIGNSSHTAFQMPMFSIAGNLTVDASGNITSQPSAFFGIGTTTQRNATSPSTGDRWLNTERNVIETWDGDIWINPDGIKVRNQTGGTILVGQPMELDGTDDGSNVPDAIYAGPSQNDVLGVVADAGGTYGDGDYLFVVTKGTYPVYSTFSVTVGETIRSIGSGNTDSILGNYTVGVFAQALQSNATTGGDTTPCLLFGVIR